MEEAENQIHTKVVGVTFEGRQAVLRTLNAGDQLLLKREPDNEYDPNAVAVMTLDGRQVGYLKKQLAIDFADAMDRNNNYSVMVEEITGVYGFEDQSLGCNIRISRQG